MTSPVPPQTPHGVQLLAPASLSYSVACPPHAGGQPGGHKALPATFSNAQGGCCEHSKSNDAVLLNSHHGGMSNAESLSCVTEFVSRTTECVS